MIKSYKMLYKNVHCNSVTVSCLLLSLQLTTSYDVKLEHKRRLWLVIENNFLLKILAVNSLIDR